MGDISKFILVIYMHVYLHNFSFMFFLGLCFAPRATDKNWDPPCATRHMTLFLSYVLF